MLRITVKDAADALVLKLEGYLGGAWVQALDVCWREAAASTHDKPIRVDLGEVICIDQPGRQLMARMHDAGVTFEARGCFTSELVREIANT